MTRRAVSKLAEAKKVATARRRSAPLAKPEAQAVELGRESSMIEAAQRQVATCRHGSTMFRQVEIVEAWSQRVAIAMPAERDQTALHWGHFR